MLDNEIQFELKKLESKLYSLLKNYNELKNKTEELNQKNEDIYIKLTLKDLEISKLKNQKEHLSQSLKSNVVLGSVLFFLFTHALSYLQGSPEASSPLPPKSSTIFQSLALVDDLL